jgi:hypothetical protein
MNYLLVAWLVAKQEIILVQSVSAINRSHHSRPSTISFTSFVDAGICTVILIGVLTVSLQLPENGKMIRSPPSQAPHQDLSSHTHWP